MKVGVSQMLKENLLEDRNRILTVGKLLPVEKTLTLSPRMNNAKSTGIAAAILPSMVASIGMWRDLDNGAGFPFRISLLVLSTSSFVFGGVQYRQWTILLSKQHALSYRRAGFLPRLRKLCKVTDSLWAWPFAPWNTQAGWRYAGTRPVLTSVLEIHSVAMTAQCRTISLLESSFVTCLGALQFLRFGKILIQSVWKLKAPKPQSLFVFWWPQASGFSGFTIMLAMYNFVGEGSRRVGKSGRANPWCETLWATFKAHLHRDYGTV